MNAQRAPEAPPLLQPHRGGGGATAQPQQELPPHEVGASLTYINVMNQFNALDNQEQFSVYATRLYCKLVDRCSRLFWKNPFKQADGYMAAICGNWSVNTLKKHRGELERRGLIRFAPGGNGAGNMGIYMLLMGGETAADLDLESYFKVSAFDTLSDALSGPILGKVSDKVSDKVSASDTNKRQKTKDKDSFLRGGFAHAQKKIELDFSGSQNPDDAPHTGGGARGRVVVLSPTLADPSQWRAQPESVEMVAAFYCGHPDEAQRAKAPRAHLFFNHYRGQGWKKGNGQLITDWRSVAEGYKCLESYGSSTNSAGGAAASRPHDRYENASKGGFGSFGAGRKKTP